WDSWGGTAAAVLSFNAGGVNTSTAMTAPASPLPIRKLSFAFMGHPSNERKWMVDSRTNNDTATCRTFATASSDHPWIPTASADTLAGCPLLLKLQWAIGFSPRRTDDPLHLGEQRVPRTPASFSLARSP